MAGLGNLTHWMRRFGDQYAARTIRSPRQVPDFVNRPDPLSIGTLKKAQHIVAGHLVLAGQSVETKGADIWSITPPSSAFDTELHGFGWLDDLAALGDKQARSLAQSWVFSWLNRYDQGRGTGWRADLAGRRVIRLLHHHALICQNRSVAEVEQYYINLSNHMQFLSKRWQAVPRGVPRLEALTGLILGGLTLTGHDDFVPPATGALVRECRQYVDADGGIATRQPSELLDIAVLLVWSAQALSAAGWTPAPSHLQAIDAIIASLRTLRHADGSLPRFHGGSRGVLGRLDFVLSQSQPGSLPKSNGVVMGYAKLSAGRTSVVMDAAPPPTGVASLQAHASTLGIELVSGRRPVIVNCGSGHDFGTKWRSASRATAAHSSATIQGLSSAKLGQTLRQGARVGQLLVNGPSKVPTEFNQDGQVARAQAAHDGYVRHCGVTHIRDIALTLDGRTLTGEDLFMAISDRDKTVCAGAGLAQGLDVAINFHVHPDVAITVLPARSKVQMTLRNGETWIFAHDGTLQLGLDTSAYLETGYAEPRATKQIILSGKIINYATRIRWSFSKSHDTALAVRDVTDVDRHHPKS